MLYTLFSYKDIPEKRIQSAFTHIAVTRRSLLQRLSSEGLLKEMITAKVVEATIKSVVCILNTHSVRSSRERM